LKNKKVKLISIILIGFLCILIGSPFIKGETTTKTLAPHQYWGLGTFLEFGDTLNFRVESDPVSINIYIMNQEQIDYYVDNPQDDATSYIKRWKGYYLLTESFTAQYDGMYYLHMINPSDSTSTYVTVDASVDEYIIPKTITITNPTSISIFKSGYNDITWTSTGTISDVRIELYKDGYFLESIDLNDYNDGFYRWYIDIDYTNGSTYQIKIMDYYDRSIYDYSDYFTIECEIDDPDDPDNYFDTIPIIVLIGISMVVVGIVLVVLLKKRSKKKSREMVIQHPEAIKPNIQPSKFCPKCGSTIVPGNSYCSNCGGVI